ncbi:CBS domain-containing protein [Streptomyces sp. NPDC004788]
MKQDKQKLQGMEDIHINDIMSTRPVTVGSHTSLAEAARMMRDADIGDVLVVDDGGKLCGIVTDRDIVVRALAEGMDPADTTVHAICSSEMVTVPPDDTLEHASSLMREHALRRLPVTDDGQLIGMVTLGDLAMERDPRSALADISSTAANT